MFYSVLLVLTNYLKEIWILVKEILTCAWGMVIFQLPLGTWISLVEIEILIAYPLGILNEIFFPSSEIVWTFLVNGILSGIFFVSPLGSENVIYKCEVSGKRAVPSSLSVSVSIGAVSCPVTGFSANEASVGVWEYG